MEHFNEVKVFTKLGLKSVGRKMSLHLENRYKMYWNKWCMGTLYDNQKSKTDFLRLVKSSFNYENYLDLVVNKDKRICLTKLRLSNHTLNIEVGIRKGIERKDRLSILCGEGC